MSELLNVTVPCPSCAGPIGFPDRACPACKAETPSALRDALEARLEGADKDYGEGKAKLRAARSMLLLLSLLSVAMGVGWYALMAMSGFDTRKEHAAELDQFLFEVFVGGALFACFIWAKRKPVPALAAGLVVWVGVQVAKTIEWPLTALPFGLVGFLHNFLRLAVLLLLVRGLAGAVRGQAIIRRMMGTYR
jgi:hypothetical protein